MTLHLLCPDNTPDLKEILHKALIRSFTRSQVQPVTIAQWQEILERRQPTAGVIANPPDEWADSLLRSFDSLSSKILLFGRIPPKLAAQLGVTTSLLPQSFAEDAACEAAPPHQSRQSRAVIRYRYTQAALGIVSPLIERPCLRYDFTDEWNNLGDGAIRADGSIWALAQAVQCDDSHALADVEVQGQSVTRYAALWHNGSSSLLWFNRPVGPVDSQEWRLVERYLSSVGYSQSRCLPVLRQIPHGFEAAVTMRLDCDEDIASAETLFEFYHAENIPFSLALCTSLLRDNRHLPLLREVIASGGSLLTHSATHPVNWGGNYQAACEEVAISRDATKRVLGTAVRVDYAVSPFHQNPPYAVTAMADKGLSGFVSGIVRNDPYYLMARGGEVPWGPEGFISHSQPCMLHGDCLRGEGDPLAMYKQSFDIVRRGGALFGYLDHPFSERYQYGWASEIERLNAHRYLITHIKKSGKVLFLSENQALDWIGYLASITLHHNASGSCITSDTGNAHAWEIEVEYGGECFVPRRKLAA